MSESDFFSPESETDSEFEEGLRRVELEKQRDIESEYLLEKMRACDISLWRVDSNVLNRWLKAETRLEDVIVSGRLKKKDSTVLLNFISDDRVAELRELAKEIVYFYDEGTQFKSYIDRVTACIIEFEYRL